MTFSILQELALFAHLTVQAISYSWENDNILIQKWIKVNNWTNSRYFEKTDSRNTIKYEYDQGSAYGTRSPASRGRGSEIWNEDGTGTHNKIRNIFLIL